MAALIQDRQTDIRRGDEFEVPVKGGVILFAGALVAAVAGVAQPASVAANLVALGRCEEFVDNSAGADGDVSVKVRAGVLHYATPGSGPDQITEANIKQVAYMIDDQTVGCVATGRSYAGIIEDVDDDGVWIRVGVVPLSGLLGSANNLSDVASAATARANIGANKTTDMIYIRTLVGTGSTYKAAGVAGAIKKILVCIQGALLTGDATITAYINGTAVTTGVVTAVQAGSAAGLVFSCTPSALNVVAQGDTLKFTVGGTNTAAVDAFVTIEIDT